MIKVLKFFFVLTLSSIFVSCSDGSKGGESALRFHLPKSFGPQQKASQIDPLIESNVGTCFAINISGAGITEQEASGCEPSYSQLSGFYKGGEEISISVPRGTNRTIELYYTPATGGECPSSPLEQQGSEKLGALGSNRVHRLGRVENIDMSQSEVTVSLPIQRPTLNNTLAALDQLPKSCEINRGAPGDVSRRARMTSGSHRGLTTDGSYIMSVRVKGSPLILESSTENLKILPHELGEQ